MPWYGPSLGTVKTSQRFVDISILFDTHLAGGGAAALWWSWRRSWGGVWPSARGRGGAAGRAAPGPGRGRAPAALAEIRTSILCIPRASHTRLLVLSYSPRTLRGEGPVVVSPVSPAAPRTWAAASLGLEASTSAARSRRTAAACAEAARSLPPSVRSRNSAYLLT